VISFRGNLVFSAMLWIR